MDKFALAFARDLELTLFLREAVSEAEVPIDKIVDNYPFRHINVKKQRGNLIGLAIESRNEAYNLSFPY